MTSDICWFESRLSVIICDSDTKAFDGLNLLRNLLVYNGYNRMLFAVREAPSHPHWLTFDNIKLHLSIGLQLSCSGLPVEFHRQQRIRLSYTPHSHQQKESSLTANNLLRLGNSFRLDKTPFQKGLDVQENKRKAQKSPCIMRCIYINMYAWE